MASRLRGRGGVEGCVLGLTVGGGARVDVLARRVAADEGDGADRRLVADEVDRIVRAWLGRGLG